MSFRKLHPATALLALAVFVATLPAAEPIFRLQGERGQQRLARRDHVEVEKLQIESVAFHALPPTHHWEGLVPVFGVEREERFELRRRPPRGQENFSEPLFFALPLEDEPDAGRIAGRWQCTATRDDNETWFAWDLTLESGQVAGRFDPDSDYRVAFITGGSFRSNQFALTVENNADRYELTGRWNAGVLTGAWHRVETTTERGAWRAKRAPHTPPPHGLPVAVPLYEFARRIDNAKHYTTNARWSETGWERAARPLCRVWSTNVVRFSPPTGR